MIEVILETECPNETEAIMRTQCTGRKRRHKRDGNRR